MERVSTIQTTVSNSDEAAQLIELLLNARLAACVQEIDIRSHYRWEAKIQNTPEVLLVIKTRASLKEQVIAFIEKHHPYDLPEIIAVGDAGGSSAYFDWVFGETDG